MASTKAAALHPYEHFAWRSLVGLVAVVAAATGFGVLLLLVRWGWPPLARFDRNVVDTFNHLITGQRAAVTILTAITNFGGRAVLFWLITVSTATMLIRRNYPAHRIPGGDRARGARPRPSDQAPRRAAAADGTHTRHDGSRL